MCSVDPDEIVEMTPASDSLDLSSGHFVCRRCSTEKAVVVLRLKDPYCKDCFLSYFVHKFRSTIGKSKQIRPGDRILIAISGGLSSSALLHLVRDGLNETSHKKLRFEPSFLYIDESCLSDPPDTGPDFSKQVCSQVAALDFPCYITSLEEVMSPHPLVLAQYGKDEKTSQLSNISLKDEVKQLFLSCKSESAQQDLLEQLQREMMYRSADALGYEKIFVADNATTLSVAILANVAQGRGSQLADRVQFKARHKDIEVFRPMREILQNEIEYYNDLQNISSLQVPTLKLTGKSITSCTEDFVMGLQREFPATIPTIFRTGDKLISTMTDTSKCSTPDPNGHSNNVDVTPLMSLVCAICGLQRDTVQSESSAVNATLISQKLSTIDITAKATDSQFANDNSSAVTINSSDIKSNIDNITSTKSCSINSDVCYSGSQQSSCCKDGVSAYNEKLKLNKISKEKLQRFLCYGCRIIVREMSEVDHLPIKVRSCVTEQERREDMREQIKDFLL